MRLEDYQRSETSFSHANALIFLIVVVKDDFEYNYFIFLIIHLDFTLNLLFIKFEFVETI